MANVYVTPIMARSLEDLETKIHELGVPGKFCVEERESTTVIGPGAHVRVDARRTLIAEPVP